MPRVSIADPKFHYDESDPEGFKLGMFRPGPDLGAVLTGTSVYEVPPGQALCPYHYEYGEEEWLLVLEGTVSVRTPAGTEESGPWELWFFPKGPDGAHQVRNDSSDTVRFLMWSTIVNPSATAYPDSGKVGVWTGIKEENLIVRRADAVDYYDGET